MKMPNNYPEEMKVDLAEPKRKTIILPREISITVKKKPLLMQQCIKMVMEKSAEGIVPKKKTGRPESFNDKDKL